MEAAGVIAELIWLLCQAVVGVVWMCFDRRGLAVVLAAAAWLWLVDSSSTSWIVVPGIVLVAGLCLHIRRERERKQAEVDRAEQDLVDEAELREREHAGA